MTFGEHGEHASSGGFARTRQRPAPMCRSSALAPPPSSARPAASSWCRRPTRARRGTTSVPECALRTRALTGEHRICGSVRRVRKAASVASSSAKQLWPRSASRRSPSNGRRRWPVGGSRLSDSDSAEPRETRPRARAPRRVGGARMAQAAISTVLHRAAWPRAFMRSPQATVREAAREAIRRSNVDAGAAPQGRRRLAPALRVDRRAARGRRRG